MAVAMMLANAVPMPLDLRFSRAVPLRHERETVEVAGFDRGRHRRTPVLRWTLRRGDRVVATAWADTGCPGVRVTIAAVGTPLPAHEGSAMADADGVLVVRFDGAAYRVQGRIGGAGNAVDRSAGAGSPLARWIDARLAALAPCWRRGES